MCLCCLVGGCGGAGGSAVAVEYSCASFALIFGKRTMFLFCIFIHRLFCYCVNNINACGGEEWRAGNRCLLRSVSRLVGVVRLFHRRCFVCLVRFRLSSSLYC